MKVNEMLSFHMINKLLIEYSGYESNAKSCLKRFFMFN